MEITLVTTLKGDEIHGTDNGKKTGCGINLQKNAALYVRGSVMKDLKELTCEKCKTNLAKKIIKADKKEMTRLIKEERARAKKGIEEEGIVPLGNTEAKITSAPEKTVPAGETPAEKTATVQPAPAAAPVSPAPAPAAPAPAPLQSTIPGTGVAIDSSLAAFAINVPKQENTAPEPQESSGDDFLAQFAINKPQEQEEEPRQSAPQPSNGAVQDDFLAQFAIPTPGSQPENKPAYEQPAVIGTTNENNYEPEYEAPVNEMDNFTAEPEAPSYEMDDFTAEPEVPSYEMDDFTAEPEAPSYEMDDTEDNINYLPEETSAESNEPVPVSHEETPVSEDISDDDLMKMFSISSGGDGGVEVLSEKLPDESSIYDNDDNVVDVEENDITAETESTAEPEAEISDSSFADWETVANQLFGVPDEKTTSPEPMPEIETPAEPEPMPEIETPAEPEPMPEIETPAESEPMPAIETPAEPEPVPEIETSAEPEPMPEIETPAEPEPMPEIETPAEPEPMPEIETLPEHDSTGDMDMKNKSKYRYSAPVFADEVNNKVETALPVQPAPVPQTTAPMPGAVPPVQPMPEQPLVMPVPQFAGYDMNGQPVYTYVQSQLVGYDANGQPVFVPLQQPVGYPQNTTAPVQPAPMPQQTVAPVQPAPMPQQTVAPVQPAPMPQQTAAPVQPAPMPYHQMHSGQQVNISKIASEKPKAMPKSFANAVANSRAKSQQNIFDMQGAQMPVLDSIEDILSSMGDESVRKQKAEEKAVPVFEEYKVPAKPASPAPKAAPKAAEPERPLTKAELKAKKKQEKIDQKFKKDLAKRGF